MLLPGILFGMLHFTKFLDGRKPLLLYGLFILPKVEPESLDLDP